MALITRRTPGMLRRRDRWPFGRLFEDMLEGFDEDFQRLPQWWGDGRFVPHIDVSEDEESVMLTAELPGMTKDDLEVTIEDGMLIMRGEKREEEVKEGATWRRTERHYGHFERRVRVPEHVDTEKIEATYKDGVLKLRMPKTEVVKPKEIPIK